jgi:hypothetical protein
MAKRARIDPEALLAAHFASEIDAERRVDRPRAPRSTMDDGNGSGWHPRRRTLHSEFAAAAALVFIAGAAALAPRGIAGSEIAEKTLFEERGTLVGRTISSSLSAAIQAFGASKRSGIEGATLPPFRNFY